MTVVILEDAAEDLESGAQFYYYEVEDDVVYVYAILDLRRDPFWIRKHLQERR